MARFFGEKRFEERGRTQRLLASVDEGASELEGERSRLERGRGAVDPLGEQDRLLSQLRRTALPRTPREQPREPLGDPRVAGSFGESALIGPRCAGVVVEAKLVDLGGSRELTCAFGGRARVRRQPLECVAECSGVAVRVEHARGFFCRHRVDRVERARALQGDEGVVGGPQPDMLDLCKPQPERQFLLRRGGGFDARPDRLSSELPARRVLVKAGFEFARRRVRRVMLEHVAHQLYCSSRVELGERGGRPRLKRQLVTTLGGDAGLFEKRTRDGAIVTTTRGRALEADECAPTIGLDRQDLLVCTRRPSGIAEDFLPKQSDTLEINDLPARIAFLLGGL